VREAIREIDLTILILTLNEEANLPYTLASLRGMGVRTIVVDSGSTDRTVEIATAAGCAVVVHPFTTQAAQVNWALDSLEIKSGWVMRLDADERVTEELAEELSSILADTPKEITAFEVKRRVYFWGRWIRYGGYYPTWLLRVWRLGTARSEQRWMDEHMVSSAGTIARLRHDIVDENHKGIAFWIDKHNRYADREVKDLLAGERSDGSVLGQAGRRRWLKTNVYRRSPLFLRAVAYWWLRYIVLLGFLDGLPGMVFHFNQALWYRLLVDAKLYEDRLKERSPSEDT